MRRTLDGYGYLYETDSGRLVSEGTVITDPLPSGLSLLELSERHDTAVRRWNESERFPAPFTNVDRIADIGVEIERLQVERAKLQGGGP